MRTILKLTPPLFEELTSHLLPAIGVREEAAFLFAIATHSEDHVTFDVADSALLSSHDFASQEGDYLELTDETRAALIKRAHDLKASLVEVHSHLGSWPAAFSPADRAGLKETVPHMWWRLSKRPYVALVFARSGFDALVWVQNSATPQALDGLLDGNRLLKPTNNSLTGW